MMKEMSRITQNENITIKTIAPEARNLIDVIMGKWEENLVNIKKSFPDYEPTFYSFTYWLIRYSELVQEIEDG